MAKQKTEKVKTATTNKPVANNWRNGNNIYAVIVFAFSFLLYFNSIFNDYNLDDELVTQNHRLTSKGISAIPEIFSSPYYQDQSGYKYEYRPIVLTTFAIEHSLFGEHAVVSHFINTLLYSLMCVLLLLVLRKLLIGYGNILSFLITLLFASHPVHTEVVASIKNRDEILSLGFALLSLYYAIAWAGKKQRLQLVAVLLFFMAGILSKSSAITFAIIIPILLVLFTRISFDSLFIVTFLLAVPATLFSRSGTLVQQVILSILLLASSVFFYAIKYYYTLWASLKKACNVLFSYSTAQSANTSLAGNINTGFFTKPGIILTWLLLIAILMALSIIGLQYGNTWLSVTPLIVMSAIYFMAGSEVKLLLIIPISLITALALTIFQEAQFLLGAALIVFIATNLLSTNKYVRFAAIAAYLVYLGISVAILHSYFFILVIVFLFFLNKKTTLLLLPVGLLTLFFYIKSIYGAISASQPITLAVLGFPVVYAGLFLVWRKKEVVATKAAVALLPLIVLVYFVVQPPVSNSLYYSIKNKYITASNIKATDPTPVQTVRPLVFMEVPVTANDPLSIKLGTALVVMIKYAKLVCVPYPLSFYYGYAVVKPTEITQPLAISSLIFHLLVLAIALSIFRKYPVPSAGLLIYLVCIIIFSNLVTPVPGIMGDRFLFIPSLGFSMVVVWLLSILFKQALTVSNVRFNELQKPFAYTLTGVLVVYSLLTVARNSNWKDRLTLFSHDIASVEESAQAHNLLALHSFIASNKETDVAKKNELRQQAMVHFKRAIEIYPKFLNASFDYARLLDAMGKYDEALKAYQYTTTIEPNFTSPYFSMGIIYQNLNQFDNATKCYEKYLSNHPKQMEAYANLSFAYYKMGDYNNSISVNRKAIANVPENAFNPLVNIGKTYLKMQINDSALYYFGLAKQLNPTDPYVSQYIQQLSTPQK